MEADNLSRCLIFKNLDIAIVRFWSLFIILPFKRLELGVPGCDVITTEFFLCSFLVVPVATIFKRSEDSSRNIDVVHLFSGPSEETL